MSDPVDPAPAGEYEPDESHMRALFARPARRPKPNPETWVAGEAFGGIDPAEAAERRYDNLHRQPQRVREEKK